MGSHSRVHYMDNLRAFAMLLGIFFHAALAYSPMLNEIWLTADPQNAAWVDMFAYFTHTFRMPLFFVIAGFFAALLTNKRGLGTMFKNRLLRIATPFAIFLPLVMMSFALIIGWSMENIENKSTMLGFIAMMAQNPDTPPPPITTTHLWFLYNLMFFYLVSIVVVKCTKFDWMRYATTSPVLFLLLAPLLLVPALMTQHAPIPAPEQFMPQLWSFGFYGLFYMLGWGLFRYETFLDQLKPYTWLLVIVSVAAYVVFYYLIPKELGIQDIMRLTTTSPDISTNQLVVSALQAYMGVFMSLALLVIGRGIFNKPNQPAKVIADSSYWIYIIHLPVLWLIQFVLLDVQWPLVVEFLLSSLGTILIGLLTYFMFVKWTPIGWLLNGKK